MPEDKFNTLIPGKPLSEAEKEALRKSNADASAEAQRMAADQRARDEREAPIEGVIADSIKNKLPARRYRVCRSDFFSNIKGQFDVILANPPYVGSLHHLDPEVKKYEPRVAYYGGRGGLSAIKRFLKEARPFVKPGGEIWMEFGMSQKTAIQGILRRLGYRSFSFRRDQYRRPRYVVIRV